MYKASPAFLPSLVAVILGTALAVMSVAFVSIPLSIGAHPGEPASAANRPAFHPT